MRDSAEGPTVSEMPPLPSIVSSMPVYVAVKFKITFLILKQWINTTLAFQTERKGKDKNKPVSRVSEHPLKSLSGCPHSTVFYL